MTDEFPAFVIDSGPFMPHFPQVVSVCTRSRSLQTIDPSLAYFSTSGKTSSFLAPKRRKPGLLPNFSSGHSQNEA